MSLRDQLQQLNSAAHAVEVADYLRVGGEQVYCVHHAAVGERRGGVLVAPPFGRERMDSYTSLVTWARRLAATGFDVLRLDYRGTGESSGRFDAVDLHTWLEDVQQAAGVLRQRLQGAPLLLHGVRFGGLLAAALFAAGNGDALLLWETPSHARDYLFEVLRGKLLEDMALGITGARKTREEHLAELQAGSTVEVDGHPWSLGLWNSAGDFRLPQLDAGEVRPWQSIRLVRNPKQRAVDRAGEWLVPVPSPPFWRDHPALIPDLSDLFAVSAQWLLGACGKVPP